MTVTVPELIQGRPVVDERCTRERPGGDTVTRPLTHRQATRLSVLRPGTAILDPAARHWGPLQRRGLVEPVILTGRQVPLRITAAGLRALADHIDRHGQPPWGDVP